MTCSVFPSSFLFLRIISKVKSSSGSYPLSGRVDFWIANSGGVWNSHWGRAGGWCSFTSRSFCLKRFCFALCCINRSLLGFLPAWLVLISLRTFKTAGAVRKGWMPGAVEMGGALLSWKQPKGSVCICCHESFQRSIWFLSCPRLCAVVGLSFPDESLPRPRVAGPHMPWKPLERHAYQHLPICHHILHSLVACSSPAVGNSTIKRSWCQASHPRCGPLPIMVSALIGWQKSSVEMFGGGAVFAST